MVKLFKNKTLRTKLISSLVLIVLIFVVFGFLSPVFAQAATAEQEAGWLESKVAAAIAFVGGGILSLLGVLFAYIARMLLWIVSYNGFLSSAPVTYGWTLVRDVANLFFVLILLAVAIGTILRIEQYNIKRLLPKVILMAVLVNFSLVLAGLMLDFAQIVMLTFTAAFATTAGEGNLILLLQLDEVVKANTTAESFSLGRLIASLFTMIIFVLIATVVILVMLAIFTFRIVMLWVLLILAPLPYVLSAFPQGMRYAQQWWQEYSKYVILGPVLAFFLWLTFAVATLNENEQILNHDISGFEPVGAETAGYFGGASVPSNVPPGPSNNIVNNPFNFTAYVVAIAMLLGSLVIAQQIGGAGAVFAGSAFSKLRSTGIGTLRNTARRVTGTAKWGANWAERKIYAGEVPMVGKYLKGWSLNPNRWAINPWGTRQKQYWEDRAKDQERKGALAAGTKSLQQFEKGGRFFGLDRIPVVGAGVRGVVGPGRRALSLLRMAQGSGPDFLKYYGSLKGATIGVGKAVLRGKSPQELKVKQAADQQRLDELESQRQLSQVTDVEEYGKDAIKKKTAKGLDRALKDKGRVEILDDTGTREIQEAGINSWLTDSITRDEIEKLAEHSDDPEQIMAAADRLKGVKKDSKGNLDFSKARGLSEKKDQQLIRDAYLKRYGDRLVEEGGIYYEADGSKKTVNEAALRQAGSEKYDQAIGRIEDQISRIGNGGITDTQVASRQKNLEQINSAMLKVLRQISRRSDKKATASEEKQLSDLREEGRALGGQIINDFQGEVGDQWGHFSASSAADRVQDLNPEDLTNRTKDEENVLRDGRVLADLRVQKEQLEKSKNLAMMSVDDRGKTQKEMASRVAVQEGRIKKRMSRREAGVAIAPVPYEALAEWRAQERAEIAKLPDEMEWDEVESALRLTIDKQDVSRVAALMKKAARDGNDNEFLNAFGFDSGFEGMKQFGDKILVKKLGMQKQQMLQLMNDIAYINEGVGHYNTARMVSVKNGVFEWRKPDDQAAGTANESVKKDSRKFLQSTNRLGYGSETPDGRYKISLSGRLLIEALQGEIFYRLDRGEMNQSAIAKIASDQETLKKMLAEGKLEQKVYDRLMTKAAEQKVKANYRALLEEAQSLQALFGEKKT